MKRTRRIIACLAGVFLLSCQPYYDAPAAGDQFLAGIHETSDLNVDVLFGAFGVEDYPEITSKLEYIISSRNFRAVVITYRTTDSSGVPVIATERCIIHWIAKYAVLWKCPDRPYEQNGVLPRISLYWRRCPYWQVMPF